MSAHHRLCTGQYNSPTTKAAQNNSYRISRRETTLTDSGIVYCSTLPAVRIEEDSEVQENCDMVSNKGFAKLDVTTLNALGWTSGSIDNGLPGPENETSNRLEEAANSSGKEGKEEENYIKLTKLEFRKFQEQVRDVGMNLRNRFRTSAYQNKTSPIPQKLYQRPNRENVNQLYRSQLAASLKAFQPKQWAPLSHSEVDPNFLRCRPINSANPNDKRPSSRCSTAGPHRPKSVPVSILQSRTVQLRGSEVPPDIKPGKFDTLSPFVLADLVTDGESPDSGYSKDTETARVIEKVDSRTEGVADDVSTTSGIESSNSSDDSSSEEDEDSDFEPEVDPNREIPDLNLRPEKLDKLYIPEPNKGWRKFDFDMDIVDLPPYDFKNPFPEELADIDLRQIAKTKGNLSQYRPSSKDTPLDSIFDRLIEMERYQMETEEWENKKSRQAQTKKKSANTATKIKDKRCCNLCLQPTCFGDCPEKVAQSNTCENCRQIFCTGTCKCLKYDQRMRLPREKEERPLTPKHLYPYACPTCQRKHTAKYINANNLILGVSKVNNATFSKGQNSLRPKDMRPKSETSFNVDMLQEFEKLGIIPTQPPPRPHTSFSRRPKSRNSMLMGKSINSQRKDSLTEPEKVLNIKRKRSKLRQKRPKTAG
ncbi:hypothetical protein CHS0354_031054 [Potamilus streckersoni]|uniref:Uncharacterized protein n=1 Tax=Potamilus streckersoni TaxID=2493646 RepID=A0AAE0TD87_9BIVA|nr:hypothetical protein CHS0354_031054 [Potamilus streckersoni]